jgi:hypothetical protein
MEDMSVALIKNFPPDSADFRHAGTRHAPPGGIAFRSTPGLPPAEAAAALPRFAAGAVDTLASAAADSVCATPARRRRGAAALI